MLVLMYPSLKELISSYTREAGVRNLEREIANVLRKAAREVVEDDTKKIKINKKKVGDYLRSSKILLRACRASN